MKKMSMINRPMGPTRRTVKLRSLICILTGMLAVAWLTTLLPSCTKDTVPKSQAGPKQDYSRLSFVVQDNYTYSLYYQGLKASGYSDTLAGEAGPFTILVPNNDAMATAEFIYNGDPTNYFLQAYDPALRDYVRYFIIPQKVSLKALPLGDNQQFPTLEGTPVYITKYKCGADTVITVNGVAVVSNGMDIVAGNGLADVIKSVPEPRIYPNLWQRMLKDASLTFFTTAALRAGLQPFFESPDQSLTVLAPSNYAFIAFLGPLNQLPDLSTIDGIRQADPSVLKKIVLYHVMQGLKFTNDLVRADSIPGDTVLFTMYNGGLLKYSQGKFVSHANTHSVAYGCNPVTNQCGYGLYGNDTIPAVGAYYFETLYRVPAVTFIDRATGNGILHEIDNVMLP